MKHREPVLAVTGEHNVSVPALNSRKGLACTRKSLQVCEVEAGLTVHTMWQLGS